MSAGKTEVSRVHDLLVEADAIVKICSYYDEEDSENAVIRCALAGVSRLLNDAMAVTGDL